MAKISINMQSGEIAKDELVLGIDLGTTNSLVAYVADGKSVLVKDASGKNALVPSILHFSDTGQLIVGDEARLKLISHPSSTIYSVKRLLGKSYTDLGNHQVSYKVIDQEDQLVKVQVGDKFYSPIELSAEILKYLKARVESQLKVACNKVVITVPAYFDDAQRQATRAAGKLAGMEVMRIINEPTAAAIAYGQGSENAEETIAVYDLGGGTFDISILKLVDGVYDVLSTNGDTYLGGDDVDKAIIAHWQKEKGISSEDLHKDVLLHQALRLRAEQAKKVLSSQPDFRQGDYTLSKDKLNELITPLIDLTIQKTKSAIEDAELSSEEIEKVVLVGGSTRIPLIKERLTGIFGSKIFDDINPDEVVALGAALQADMLAGNNEDMLLLDVTPLSLGIETVGGLMDTIIPRNSKIPTSIGRSYTTSVDGQTKLKVSVFQGERELVEHNRQLGQFILEGIPPMPAGIPKIKVSFVIDADGIMRVKAIEERSETQTEVVIKSQYGISEEEMGQMLIDSIKHAKTDMLLKGLVDAKNEGNALIFSATKFTKQNSHLLSEEEQIRLGTMISVIKEKVTSDDKDEILKAVESLNEYSKPLAERVMDYNISEALRGKNLG